jgi:asparagine synthase (glutamine-hydrolysing)
MGVLPNPQMGITFYGGVKAMPASHYLTVAKHGRSLQRYWDIQPSEEVGNFEPSQVVAKFGALFTDAVRLRLRADVPVGTCLSGGLDSSSIVGVVTQTMQHEQGISAGRLGKHQKTFSAVYHADGAFNERQHIEVMATHTGVDANFTFPTAERLLTDLERLVWYQDEPFPGVSIFAQWCVMHLARERGVSVLLDGQGADEMLAGYRPFWVYLAEKIKHGQLRQVLLDARDIRIATGLPILSMLRISILSIVLQLPPRILVPLQRALRQPLKILAPLQRAFSVRKGETTRTCLNPFFVHSFKDRFYHQATVLIDRSMSDCAYRAIFENSLPYLLRYEDRNSMAFSIEARVPFLDHRLVDYTFGPAAPWRIHAGWTKWVLRKAMADVLPPAIAWRQDKVGFELPEQDLLYKIGSVMRDRFTRESAVGKYLNANVVQSVLEWEVPFVDEARRRWRWINLETWLRLWQSKGVS